MTEWNQPPFLPHPKPKSFQEFHPMQNFPISDVPYFNAPLPKQNNLFQSWFYQMVKRQSCYGFPFLASFSKSHFILFAALLAQAGFILLEEQWSQLQALIQVGIFCSTCPASEQELFPFHSQFVSLSHRHATAVLAQVSMSACSIHFSAQLSSKVAACPMTTEMDAFNPQKKKKKKHNSLYC